MILNNTKERPLRGRSFVLLCTHFKKSEIALNARRSEFLRPSRTRGTTRGEKIRYNKVDEVPYDFLLFQTVRSGLATKIDE